MPFLYSDVRQVFGEFGKILLGEFLHAELHVDQRWNPGERVEEQHVENADAAPVARNIAIKRGQE